MEKLYRVMSTLKELEHQGRHYANVNVKWFAADRQDPIMDPKEVIEDYEQLDEVECNHRRKVLDQFFSEAEAKALRECLFALEEISMTRVEEMPLSYLQCCGSFQAVLDIDYNDCSHGTLILPREYYKDILPFEVRGFYDVTDKLWEDEEETSPRMKLVCIQGGKKSPAEQ